ncbi:MAG: zinc ribbon domain-containing protein [Thermoplasmata archaeon]|nr:MAG: zinc ribbon domain-containing protein [Thermoplasmata archaeon]
MSYCTNCGTKLTEDWDFCSECGEKIAKSIVHPPPPPPPPHSNLEDEGVQSREKSTIPVALPTPPPPPPPQLQPIQPTQPPQYQPQYQYPMVAPVAERQKSRGPIYAIVAIVVAIVVLFAFMNLIGPGINYNPFSEDTENKDRDGDGYNNDIDAFPDDPNEWEDTDGDGIGNNADTDDDNDGFSDSEDIFPLKDVGIQIKLTGFEIVDPIDFWDSYGEVYFHVYINDRFEGKIDNDGATWSALQGSYYTIDVFLPYNVNDNQANTKINIQMWDDDLFDDDLVDIDGLDETHGLTVTYDLSSGQWTGDDDDGYTDGSDDGTQNSDDDDGILSYSIENYDVTYNKVFNWMYSNKDFELSVNIPPDLYAYYSSLPRTSDEASYVTSDDEVVSEIATLLLQKADDEGYDYYGTVNFVLRFVQSIEYTADNVSTGMNEYWRYSVETLVDENGDCEDTSILFASLMEAMDYDAVLLLPTGHAAVGIYGTSYNGWRVEYQGKEYFYCETTAEGWEMGEMPEEYENEEVDVIQVE